MQHLKNKTIREKLTSIMLVVCLTAMSLTTIALVLFFGITIGQTTVDGIMVNAAMTAENCNYGLAFSVVEDVNGVLASLRTNPDVVFAGVYKSDHTLFASYERQGDGTALPPQELRPDGWYVHHGYLTAYKGIVLENEKIGTLCIQCDLAPFYRLFWRTLLCVLVVLGVTYKLAYYLAHRLQHVISGPILALTNVAQSVTENKDYSVRADKPCNDEVGILIDAFNGMLEQIKAHDEALVEKNEALANEVAEREEAQRQFEQAHKQMLSASRRAGMEEVATDVLHNVGNVLNSLNLTTEIINGKLKESKLQNLNEVCRMLEEHQDNLVAYLSTDQKGKRIPAYIQKVLPILNEEQEELIQRARDLEANVKHIKDVVRTQQSYAKAAGLKLETTLQKVVDNAIQINATSLKRHEITVKQSVNVTEPLVLDQQRLLQVLVNLITNAKHALSAKGNAHKRIDINAYAYQGDRFYIEVRDNGIGIPPENITKIFRHGFTTRKSGHGFGLHGSALAVQEMGGTLTAHSDGPGQGATFTIDLPLQRVEETPHV